MNAKKALLTVILMPGLLLAGRAQAANPHDDHQGKTQPTQEVIDVNEGPNGYPVETVTMGVTGLVSANLPKPWLASSLLGGDTYDMACNTVGKVAGLVIGQSTGEIEYVWMSAGEDLGMKDQYLMIPWELTTWSDPQSDINCSEAALILATNMQVLKSGPGFDSLPDLTAANWGKDVQAYWEKQFGGALDFIETGAPVMVDQLNSWRVLSNDKSNLGPIKDIAIDPTTGSVDALIWEPGGLLEISPRLVPLPLTAGKLDASANQFVLKRIVDEKALAQAPSFQSLGEIGNPQNHPDWIQQARTFWGKLS
jgi:sporulation protein YlmC with PRC-barrel domain